MSNNKYTKYYLIKTPGLNILGNLFVKRKHVFQSGNRIIPVTAEQMHEDGFSSISGNCRHAIQLTKAQFMFIKPEDITKEQINRMIKKKEYPWDKIKIVPIPKVKGE